MFIADGKMSFGTHKNKENILPYRQNVVSLHPIYAGKARKSRYRVVSRLPVEP